MKTSRNLGDNGERYADTLRDRERDRQRQKQRQTDRQRQREADRRRKNHTGCMFDLQQDRLNNRYHHGSSGSVRYPHRQEPGRYHQSQHYPVHTDKHVNTLAVESDCSSSQRIRTIAVSPAQRKSHYHHFDKL